MKGNSTVLYKAEVTRLVGGLLCSVELDDRHR